MEHPFTFLLGSTPESNSKQTLSVTFHLLLGTERVIRALFAPYGPGNTMTRSHAKKEASTLKNHPKPRSSATTHTTLTSHGGRSSVSSTAGPPLLTKAPSDAQSTFESTDFISDHRISRGVARSDASKGPLPASSTPKRKGNLDEPHRREQRSRPKQELATTSGVSRERDHEQLGFSTRALGPAVSRSVPSTEDLYPFQPTPTSTYGHYQGHGHHRDKDKRPQRPWIGGNTESVTSEAIATKSRVTSWAHGRYGMCAVFFPGVSSVHQQQQQKQPINQQQSQELGDDTTTKQQKGWFVGRQERNALRCSPNRLERRFFFLLEVDMRQEERTQSE